MTAVLGISAFYHDSAAALIIDGRIVAAAQEERFTREKHDDGFPKHAIAYCLHEAGLSSSELDYVGFYDKPLMKFERLLETYLAFAPVGFKSFSKAMPLWINQKLHLPREMRSALGGQYKKRFIFTEHHEAHAASAFFPSPFQEAAILTLDGVGEWATASWGFGRGNEINLLHELRFPHSLGLLYSAFTYFTGFEVNSGEYKLMGLAPYGEPQYVDLILDKLIDLKEDGSFRMDLSYFNYCQGLTMTSKKFDKLFDRPPRRPGSEITQQDMDIAASIQWVTEEIMLRAARHVHARTGMTNLCLAGGVALNCVGNGRILREGPYENIWIQPAAGDAGGALGVAAFIWYQLLGHERKAAPGDEQRGSLLGAAYTDAEIQAFLDKTGAVYKHYKDDEALCGSIAEAIAHNKVVGWFQGGMEFGPRALGSRSILGDARDETMQRTINMKVKFREGFRPFAPIILREHVHEYFDMNGQQESPYMLLVTTVRADKRLEHPPELAGTRGLDLLKQKRSVIPAVTHVDYSARIQTVDSERHGLLHRLMERFYEKTGCPVMVNTSFNLSWEPIVCSPEDAYRTFMGSGIDVLCMGHFVLTKPIQPAAAKVVSNAAAGPVLDDKLCSPCCGADLRRYEDERVCAACGNRFGEDGNIPQLFWPHERFGDSGDVTRRVKGFYEETPFPNYNDHDSVRSLIEKSRSGIYGRALDRSIPYNSSVLEVGCGTGQLTNFLGISCRQVIGTDMTLNALRLGEAFRKEHDLDRVRFVQMNLFCPAFKEAQFDVVLSNGVLHHTADPLGGFKRLVPLVKPGGYFIVGLYNILGRLATDLRRQLFRITGNRFRWIDPILRQDGLSSSRQKAWFSDQYLHPHESKHSIGEVLRWFDETGLAFVRGVPSVTPFAEPLDPQDLFASMPRGTALDHFLMQIKQISGGNHEGGFFIMIGRKPFGPTTPPIPGDVLKVSKWD